MRLIEAEFRNIAQHQYQHVKFDKGLNAITGPNGAGKTNLMAALYAGITNDCSRFSSNRSGIISQYASEKSRSSIRVVMEHHNIRAEITRNLRPVGRSLVINNGEPITKETDVAYEIEKWFGLPLKVIGQYIFVNQWEMFSLLKESPSERAKDLFRLFGIDQAETCWNIIGDRLCKLSGYNTGINIDLIRTRLMTNRSRVRDLQTQIGVLKDVPDNPPEGWWQEYTATQDAWNKHLKLTEEIGDIEADLETIEDSISGYKTQLEEKEKEEADYKSTLNIVLGKKYEMQRQSAVWQTYQRVRDSKHKLEAFREELLTEAANRVPPQPPAYYDRFESRVKLEQEINSTRITLAESHKFLETFKDGIAACPVCHTPADCLHDRKGEYEERVRVLEPHLQYLLECQSGIGRYHSDYQTYLGWQSSFNSRLSSVERQLSSLPNVEEPEGFDPDEFNRICSNCEFYEHQIDAIQLPLKNIRRELARLEGSKSSFLQRITNIRTELNSFDVDEDKVQASLKELHEKEFKIREKGRLLTEINYIKKAISDDELTIEEAANSIKRSQKINDLRKELIAVRNIIHKDALPKLIAQSHLAELEVQMNKSLEDLGVDFRVSHHENLCFRCIFPDGRNVPAEALSGGEMVVFALAWRLAVNSTFASDIGLLCLDEPTAGLDKDRLSCLRLALEKMRTMSLSRGLQCVIITHEPSLMPLFDNVIDLKPPTGK